VGGILRRMSRKSLAAALLLVALSARAQVEVRPIVALPSAPGIFALPPSAALASALAPASLAALSVPLAPIPAALAAAAPVSAASAPVPPAQARSAAVAAAVADFARTDLKTASAGEASGAGETLMLRALGADVPASVAPPVESAEFPVPALAPLPLPGRHSAPKVYLLSKPLRETVGPVSIPLHIAITVTWEATKALIAYKATGSLAAAGTLFAFELALSPPMLTARTLGDLGLRYWGRKLAVLKELAVTPGVTRVKVLTTGPVTFTGPFARRKDNTGLIFVEAEGDLPQVVGRFGAPIHLGDVAASRVRLAFIHGGMTAGAAWTPTLGELLDGHPIPPEIAAAWRAHAKSTKAGLKKLLDSARGKERIEATLIAADGNERSIGAIVEGPGARKLVGLGALDRARAFLGWHLPSRTLPVSDTVVERPGDARGTGMKDALRRAWRRLMGNLIVARESN
jgi:hypothetical protein